jgi:hypothetical protein
VGGERWGVGLRYPAVLEQHQHQHPVVILLLVAAPEAVAVAPPGHLLRLVAPELELGAEADHDWEIQSRVNHTDPL